MKGYFQITNWNETPYDEDKNGHKKSQAIVMQDYSGDIEGNSEVQYLMSYQSENEAVFVGFEVIKGQINGKKGSFTLMHIGEFTNGCAKSDFSIVPGSGTEQLSDIDGSGCFVSGEAGQASYRIELKN